MHSEHLWLRSTHSSMLYSTELSEESYKSMQKVLTNDLWKAARARRTKRKMAAIAYVTQDLLGFRKGDTLVADASAYAVRNAETSAKLLRTLHKKGVRLYDCACLHAKVLLLDDVAVISSGNMSKSSEKG